MTDDELIAQLSDVSGALFDQPELLAEWARDWSPYGAKIEVWDDDLPLIAISPDSAEDVAQAVRIAGEADRPVLIRGGGSGLSGSLFPVPGAIMLDLAGLNVIDLIDEARGTVAVDAGVFGGELEAHLNVHGCTLPLQPRSLNLSTIGGWVATRAHGLLSTKNGDIRERIAALQVVLASGEIVEVTESAEIERWCGSFGAYGVVTRATLRIEPIRDVRLSAYALPDIASALEAARVARMSDAAPALLAVQEEAVEAGSRTLVVIGYDGDEGDESNGRALVERAGGEALDAGFAGDWWEERGSSSWLIDGNEEEGWIADAFDCWLPWPGLIESIAAMRAALTPHVDQVRVHAEFSTPAEMLTSFRIAIRDRSDERALGRYERARDAARAATHVTGRPRVEAIDPDLKRALDPTGRFAQGEPRRR